MEEQTNLTNLSQSLEKAKNILVLAPANPNLDKIAALLALFLSLKKQGKQVSVACSSPITVAFNRLVGVDKLTDKIGNRNLVISFDYQKDFLEKVSYNIENNKFNLVVEPRVGQATLDPSKVSYSYSGSEADLIFVIGASKLEELEKLYFNEKNTFAKATVVNLDNKAINTKFGQINVVDSQYASCSEIVANLLRTLNLPVDQDIATNILAGIEANTVNLQAPATSAATFEIVAWCLKNNARRGTQPALNPFGSLVGGENVSQPKTADTFSQQPPPDWFKPKIFKGSSQI